MTLQKLENMSTELIKNFVNKVGYDGEEYVKNSGMPYIYVVDNIYDGIGETITGTFYEEDMDEDIEEIKLNEEIDKQQEKSIRERGYIKILKKDTYDYDDLITLIHERFHINRNTIAKDVSRDNIFAYDELKNNKDVSTHLFEFGEKTEELQGDFSQNFLKGRFDTNEKKLLSILKKYKTKMEQLNLEKHSKYKFSKILGYQINVDETLIELMSNLCYKLYKTPNKSIIELLQEISNIEINKDCDLQDKRIIYISKIIVFHNDLELFKWMLNPIEYTIGDMKYDYFKEYTKNDPKEWLNIFDKTIDEVGIYDYDIIDYFVKMEKKVKHK